MEEKNKDHYESPTTTVVEMTMEGIVCGSGDANKNGYPYGGNQDWTW